MYVSMKVWDNENDEGGRFELYRRNSFTCTEAIGVIHFEDKVEKKVLMDMLTTSHPDVTIMPNDATTGNFTKVYFKV